MPAHSFIRRPVMAALLISCLLTACAAPAPTWRTKASSQVEVLAKQDALVFFPQEYNNLLETFEHGEAVLHVQGDDRQADVLYLLVLQKGALLKDELIKRRQRMAEEQRQRAAAAAAAEAAAAAQAEEERLILQAAEAEARLRKQERQAAEREARDAAAASQELSRESLQQQSIRYTVRRGETLPQIAARNEIYNDSSLWPLIYRANRDQIRDPRQLWPGQVLKIPRHFTRDEALEAKRYSGKK